MRCTPHHTYLGTCTARHHPACSSPSFLRTGPATPSHASVPSSGTYLGPGRLPAPAPLPLNPPLPTDKLSCKAASTQPRTPVVLVAAGSFNPPTVMHLRMAELAADELLRRGYDVWGVYFSPVADSYGKAGLAPAADRVAMCRLAAAATSTAATSAVVREGAHVSGSGGGGSKGYGGSGGGGGHGSSGVGGRDGAGPVAPLPAGGGSEAIQPRPQLQQLQPPPSQQHQLLPQQPQLQLQPSKLQPLLLPDPEPDLVMVDGWEAAQPGYTRTLAVLRRVEGELRAWLLQAAGAAGAGTGPEAAEAAEAEEQEGQRPPPAVGGGVQAAQAGGPGQGQGQARASTGVVQQQQDRQDRQQQQERPVRAMLLCGADVLASMASPGVWRNPDVILREHGVVCIARAGSPLDGLLSTPGNVLHDHRDRVVLVYDHVGNSISSSAVRAELAAGRPVRHLLPAGVAAYIHARGLYSSTGTGTGMRGGDRVGGGGGGGEGGGVEGAGGRMAVGAGAAGRSGGGLAGRAGSLEVIV
uniref:Nicotinate/nicotinamide mononucleotide adenylyltransferase n=2 Tax=Chlamydomonas reinhardtii TaxID=3055 RepID=C4PG66_CHLRE|nr:nicotinate/nicotinamide mononucleotide adenylyltransferase [Chlamydomonas reinhardtii]